MAIHRYSIFGSHARQTRNKATGSHRLAPAVKNDVFLNALLEMPRTK